MMAIVGASCLCKTKYAIEMAREIDGALICCDTLQLFKGFKIGAGVVDMPVFNFLYNSQEPGDRISEEEYFCLAKNSVKKARKMNKIPIFEGCSDDYYKVLKEYYGEKLTSIILTCDGIPMKIAEKRLNSFLYWPLMHEVKMLKREYGDAYPFQEGIIYKHMNRYINNNKTLEEVKIDILDEWQKHFIKWNNAFKRIAEGWM